MKRQKKLIENSNWNNIIYLDACRYDFFKSLYTLFPNLENGKFQKVITEGSNSAESIENTFTGYYDCNVYSSHPAINSKAVEINMPGASGNYKASNHFAKIYDIFEQDHDELNVTLPEVVRKNVEEYYDGSKSIIWFMQPHAPYIGSVTLASPDNTMEGPVPNHVPGFNQMVPYAYKYNLIRVLFEVGCLLGTLKGKTIITSDHGELLFDDFGHPPHSQKPELRHVPWLELNADNIIGYHDMNPEDFISDIYSSILSREPDSEGLEHYTNCLLSGTRTRREIFEIIYQSDESKMKNNFIVKLD